METKSRYEVIKELEEQKRKLITERDNLDLEIKESEQALNIHQRNKKQWEKQRSREEEDWVEKWENVKEDVEKQLELRKERKGQRTETLNELIKSIDQSLERFNNKK